LEDVSSTEELAKSLRCSSDVVLRMAQKGMPHTHAGREYRFHKALLIEWTRTGQNPFPCVACQTSETEKQSVQQSEEPQSTNLRPIRPEISHKSANKLASLVGGN
jgi:excisionase family DNA binding protein